MQFARDIRESRQGDLTPLFILDGLDELRVTDRQAFRSENLYSTLQIEQQFPAARVVVTCRTNALLENERKKVLAPPGGVAMEVRVLLPFTMDNMKAYVEAREDVALP